ncbi:arylsulfatase [Wenyingzhuangia fucanilytica]|uniref:Arylsulfatase n=1 Tax=Wenyingzhuangia fucanilytica TaxID=1790137 RepID=A0A1B1Y3E8_9FLAO|nr:arylsulfatase [Wenyingzhuangia fucanilytica]ANW95294.1 arylsulfatase [Wenyingzhuangia fucanilytica]
MISFKKSSSLKISTIVISTLFYTACYAQNISEKAVEKPNIIYILADDLGIGDVQVFNKNGKIKTPNLDQLALEGMRFTDAHTSSSVCTPTRYGIMTGRYNWRTTLKKGVLNGTSKALIPKNRTTVASLLKKQGYDTAFIGKWHLGWDWAEKPNVKGKDSYDFSKPVSHTPNDLGFDYAYGICGSLDMAPYIYVENSKPTAKSETIANGNKGYGFWRKGPVADDFEHEQVLPNFINRSVKYIESKKNSKKPFFLYVPLPSPHTPILPTKEFQGKSGLNPYGDFVMMVDAYVGKIFDIVKAQGMENNTLIIFTSDNGTSGKANFKALKDKGHDPSAGYRGLKATIFEGGHRVPFIAKWTGVIKPNTISNQTICTTDFMATCADIVNYKLQNNEGEDSFSMLPILKNEIIHGDFREATVHHSSGGFFSIRKGPWKLIFCKDDGGYKELKNSSEIKGLEYQLYNLENDPSEKNNLYTENVIKYKELKNLLKKYIKEGRSTPGKVQQNDIIDFEWTQINSIMQ